AEFGQHAVRPPQVPGRRTNAAVERLHVALPHAATIAAIYSSEAACNPLRLGRTRSRCAFERRARPARTIALRHCTTVSGIWTANDACFAPCFTPCARTACRRRRRARAGGAVHVRR